MSEELKRKLKSYSIKPSEKVWNKISIALDEENGELAQKLYNAEIKPPAGTWNKIVTGLETVEPEKYAAKLYSFEADPPPASWQKISSALDEEKLFPHIPSKRKIVLFVRYAAAACLICAIAVGAFKLSKRKTTVYPVAGKTVLPQNSSPSIVPESQKNSSAGELPPVSNALPKERDVLAQSGRAGKNLFQETGYMAQTVNQPVADNSSSLACDFEQASLTGDIPGSCPLISDTDPYLTFINPDGYLIRISKKLAETLGCIYTNGNPEGYKKCDEQIKKWGNKIAQSPASPGTDNFLNIIDIIKSAQDN